MPGVVFKGRFYEFERERNVARPGQPVVMRTGMEIGREISRPLAAGRVKNGKDVYTPAKEDAYRLARDVHPGVPDEEIHEPRVPSPTGRTDVYYQHFHPGGFHLDDGYGHIYFGTRGEGAGD